MPPFRFALNFLKQTAHRSASKRRRALRAAFTAPEILETRLLLSAENIVIQDDFETGSPSADWDLVLSSDNSDGVVSGIARTGNYSYHINYSYDEDQGTLQKFNLMSQEEGYFRYWQMYPTGFDQRNLKQSYLFHANADPDVGLQGNITLSLYGQAIYFDEVNMLTTFYGGAGHNGVEDNDDVRGDYTKFPIVPGEWFRTAFYYKFNTLGQSNGEYKLWLDDQLIVDLNDVKFRSTNKSPDALWIGGNYSGGGADPVPFDRYIDDIFVARTPADDPEFNPTVPESFDANGTAGIDAFVLAYSGNTDDSTVSVSVSSNGAAAQDLGTFAMSTAINLNGFGGTDSVRVVGSNLNDSFDVSGAGLLVNGSRVVLNSIERRTLVGGIGNDSYKFDTDASLGSYSLSETGSGIDTIDFSKTSNLGVVMSLGTTVDQIVNQNVRLRLNSASAFENLIGGAGYDILTGNAHPNRITGNEGGDRIDGGSASDVLVGGSGDDHYIFKADGVADEVDSIIEASGRESDTLDFSALSIPVKVNISTGAQQTIHTNRSLILGSGVGVENVVGGFGNDRLIGNSRSNTLVGNAGNDIINGWLGSDQLIGGPGSDTYWFGRATVGGEVDTISETARQDSDTLDFSSRLTAVTVNISTDLQQIVHTDRSLILGSGLGIDIVLGGSGNDRLTGNSLANVLVGNAGNDTLIGNSGRDILIGGQGLDTISGGNDDDIVIAGRTTSDSSPANLSTLLTGWQAATSYSTRVAALRAGVGSPKVSLIKKTNVLNDSGQDDNLSGGAGADWFFRATDDVIADLVNGELIDVL